MGTRPVTSNVRTIRTITRDGIVNSFKDIQVISSVNTANLIQMIRKFGTEFRDALIFDRVAEELRIFCANHTIDEVYNSMFLDIVRHVKTNVEESIDRLGQEGITGVKILNLVIPKPDIPSDIAANYKQVKVQWTEQLVATQQQKTEKIKKETQSIKAILDAERERDVLKIDIEKQLLEKEGESKRNDIQNQIIKDREQNTANITAYAKERAAEANKLLYTDEYVKLEMARSLTNNTKFYFSGETSPLGGLLTKILN